MLNRLAANSSISITALSLIVNCGVFLNYREGPFSSFLLWDAAHYWEWALRIAGGDWLRTSVFHQPPLYPYILAVFITVFGKTLTPVYLFQSVLSAATAAMICRLAISMTGSRRVGLISGLLYVFYGMQVFYTFKVLSECTATFLLVLAALSMTSEKAGIGTVAAGVATGFVLLIKPHFLMALQLLCGFYFFRTAGISPKTALKHAALFVVAVVVSVTAVRNFAVAKEFTLVSQNGGETFYLGNNEHANGTYVPVQGISGDIAWQNEDVITRARE